MYINDFYNVIEIKDILYQSLGNIEVFDKYKYNKFKKVEIIVPFLFHRNRDMSDGLCPELFSKVKYLDFPYETSYLFRGATEPSEVIIRDDFIVDKTAKDFSVKKELDKYIRTEIHSSGYKCWFAVYVRGIGEEE